MFSLVDIRLIIKKHYETLCHDAKLRFVIIIFLLIPLITSIVLVKNDKLLTQNSVNALITAFAIFTAFLLNVIFILFSIVDKIKGEAIQIRKRKLLLEHLYANSLYALLVSTIILTFLIGIVITEIWYDFTLLSIFSYFIYFSIAHFLMTFLMIFKRLFILLFGQLEKCDETNKMKGDD